MSKVVSLRLRDEQMERLQRAARRLGRTPSETAALLLEEALRQRDFALIEFRDSPVGRQASAQGTRLTVWQIAAISHAFGADTSSIAAHLEVPEACVKAALGYAAAYPAEIDAAVEDSESASGHLTRLIPDLMVVEVDAAAS